MKAILKCSPCNGYSMKEHCPQCGKETIPVKPPKYSPDDKYAKYRRQALRPKLEEKGII